MEYLDIINNDGTVSGKIKERSLVHLEGDLHHTAHVWIARKNNKSGMDLLLQMRSKNKDSFPGCYDISSAGHIPAGCDYIESAIRELKEELGIEAKKEELEYKGTRRFLWKAEFHGKPFIDNQFSRVYLLWREDILIESLELQESEVESVVWMDYEECLEKLKNNTFPNCIVEEELYLLR